MRREQVIEAMAQGICREKCAFMGEPPCFEIMDKVDDQWPPAGCCEPGCVSEATAALAAIEAAGIEIEFMHTHRDEPGVERTGLSFYGEKDGDTND